MHQQHPQQQPGWGAPQPPKKRVSKKLKIVGGVFLGLMAIGALANGGNSGDSNKDTTASNSAKAKPTPSAKSEPSPDVSAAEKAAGIPPKPTGEKRQQLLNALKKAAPDTVKYEDKAIDAARNQCSAINSASAKADWAASQRFTYKDVTTTEAQGKQINEALKGLGFCKV
ncbi:hypothetical protein ABZ865_02170 [Streptomyces sp. NPDC047085]|uniref:hypothetical protein n=1 Tax=Streptomyces sp. NPDC047085 TaxID=3155140 RepID=UPI0033C8F0B9